MSTSFDAKLKSFWSNVQIKQPNECWEWLGSISNSGYGLWRRGSDHGFSKAAHRTAFLSTGKTIPPFYHVLHTCDNPICCNPGHLFLGTNQDNVDDKISKERHNHGSTHPASRLNEKQVIQILLDSRQHKDIAKDYGISRVQVTNIKLRKRWKHVKLPDTS